MSNSANSSPLEPFNMEKELEAISKSCMTNDDYEKFVGNIVRYFIVRYMYSDLMEETVIRIGLTELRKSLNFGPIRPWKIFNATEPSEEDLENAKSLEEYYNLKEPYSGHLDNQLLFEKNLIPAEEYLDERFPSIRDMFRIRFEEIISEGGGPINTKLIDRLIVEYNRIKERVGEATKKLRRLGNCLHQ
ncbi:hypothetical protein CAEBREN_13699 [Caenorhabditis brenneri]|uniref:Uncharacterized protein n=1 Tax=Caenorhabditis brenneri TaxID=135651 RepID=G0N2Y4_CAEBE|nr:hypothetical protein CAEBREN_13699 [Caenorhabditis brenneri]